MTPAVQRHTPARLLYAFLQKSLPYSLESLAITFAFLRRGQATGAAGLRHRSHHKEVPATCSLRLPSSPPSSPFPPPYPSLPSHLTLSPAISRSGRSPPPRAAAPCRARSPTAARDARKPTRASRRSARLLARGCSRARLHAASASF